MDRAEALTYLQSAGFDKLMKAAGRVETDCSTGYGPSLDSAFEYHEQLRPEAEEVAYADELGFKILLRATVLDLIEPLVCSFVDTQVDAPLTQTKGSQLCSQVMKMREATWSRAASAGYGVMYEVGGFKVNLDFLENSETTEEA
jgi:hypothetical protein